MEHVKRELLETKAAEDKKKKCEFVSKTLFLAIDFFFSKGLDKMKRVFYSLWLQANIYTCSISIVVKCWYSI